MDFDKIHCIGKRVRVTDKSRNTDNFSRKGIISYHHNRTNSYDIIYDNHGEENEVLLSRIESIEDFEKYNSTTATNIPASTLKEYGNVLFGKRDYVESEKYYLRGLESLVNSSSSATKRVYSVGSYVIVQDQSNALMNFRNAIVNDVNKELTTVDVFYLNNVKLIDSFGKDLVLEDDIKNIDIIDEEENLSIAKRLVVCYPENELDLQRSLYLNLCRVKLKTKTYGWAIKYASLAIAVTKFIVYKFTTDDCTASSKSSQIATDLEMKPNFHDIDATHNKFTKYLADAYYLRGVALLHAGRPQLATLDRKRLYDFDAVRSQSLNSQIDIFVRKRHQSNKTLAVEVSKWVDSAMTQYEELQQQHAKESENEAVEQLFETSSTDADTMELSPVKVSASTSSPNLHIHKFIVTNKSIWFWLLRTTSLIIFAVFLSHAIRLYWRYQS